MCNAHPDRRLHLAVLPVLILISLVPSPARAVSRAWTGAGSNNLWTNAANWGGTAPVAGDDLTFPAGAVQLSNSNNFAATTPFNSITFSGSNYTIVGNAITNTAGITNTPVSGTNTFDCPLTLAAGQTILCATNTTLALNGTLNKNNQTLTFDTSGTIQASGVISSGGTLNKSSGGTLILSGTNTYTSSTIINAGIVVVQNSSALGATGSTAATQLSPGALLELQNNIVLGEQLTLTGSSGLRNLAGTNIITGNIVSTFSTATVQVDANTSLTLSNVWSSTGGFIKLGPGPLTLAGTSNNVYQGTTTVNDGTLILNKPAGTNAIPLGSVGLVIGDGAGGLGADVVRLASSNQIPDSLAITINSSGTLNLNGFSDKVGALTMDAGSVTTGTGTLTLGGGVIRAETGETNASLISGNLSLGGFTRSFTINTNPNAPAMTISATISDGGASAGITKLGGGTLLLSSSNSYSGATTISEGIIQLSDGSALGASGGGTTIASGAELQLAGSNITYVEATITLAGTLSVTSPSAYSPLMTGDITLAATNAIVNPDSASLSLSGALSGTGGLTKLGASGLTLSGTNSNTYAGSTVVGGSSITLSKTAGAIAIAGPLLATNGQVTINGNDQIADSAPVTLISPALMVTHGFSDTIGSLSGSGGIAFSLTNAETLIVGADNTSTTYSGQVTQSGGLTKIGTGTLTLSANNQYTGPTRINAGTLLVNGAQASSAVTVAGGTLGGSGVCGPITALSGQVSPGNSPGILTASGDLTLTNLASFSVELNGTNAGADYDQLNVTGAVNLANCALNASLGFTPPVGTVFTIVSNDAADTVLGTFAELSEGTGFALGGSALRISYVGGSGNDVTLTAIPFSSGATQTWTGNGTNALWSNAVNWSNNILPGFGDNLVFPPGASRLTNTNDLPAGTRFNSVSISSASFGYSIFGNALSLNSGISNAGGAANVVTCPLILASNQSVSSISGTLNLSGTVDNGGNNLNIAGGGAIYAAGAISGAGGMQKTGTGLLVLSGTNTYTGLTAFGGGAVILQNGSALGATTAGTTVSNAAGLLIQLAISLPEPLTIYGSIQSVDSTNILTGNIILATNCTISINPNSELILSNAVSGAGSLTKIGPGTLTLAGTNANTYSGSTLVNEGTLALNKSGGVDAVPSGLRIGDAVHTATAFLLAPNQIANSARLVISNLSTLALNGNSETIGSFSGAGTINLGSGTLTTGGDNSSTNFTGFITGSGGLTKNGNGFLDLLGNGDYTGTTLINAGSLLVDGFQPASPITLAGGFLGGSGTCGAITALSGIVNPGGLGSGTGTGILAVNGNVVLTNGISLVMNINGYTPGANYDQLSVTGAVNLANAGLSLPAVFVPTNGTTFTLISNDGTEAVTNTFSAMPEGTKFSPNGASYFSISYKGGDGNDVVITKVPEASGKTRTWTGLGANAFWITSANWSNNVFPGFGDDIVFPAGASRLTNTNDFSALSRFNSITLAGTNYNISGSSILLNAGLTNLDAVGATNTFNCPLTLASNETILVATNTVLVLNTNIDVSSNTLSLNISGSASIGGVISGTGGGFTKIGTGTVVLSATNTFTGFATISGGTVSILNASALGSAVLPNVSVLSGGTLSLQNNITLNKITLFLTGTLDSASGGNNFVPGTGGGLSISGSPTISVATNASLDLKCAIIGTASLTKTGPGQLIFSGTNANTYSGDTIVNGGFLLLNKFAGTNLLTAIPGALVIGDGVGGPNADVVRLLSSGQIADTPFLGFNPAAVTITNSGLLDVNGLSETIGSLAGSPGANVIMGTSGGTLIVGADGTSSTYSGNIGNSGTTFEKTGNGTLTLAGTNSCTVFMEQGTLLVNGVQNGGTLFLDGGTLGGSGTVGNIQGSSPGAISPGNSPGVLNCGNVTFNGAAFNIELNGTNAGSGYDQLNVIGTANINGAVLHPSLGFTPPVGASFTILNNDASDPVGGSFSNLLSGSTFVIGGFPFQVFYNAAGGNDVVLTRIASAPSQITSISAASNSTMQLQGLGQSNLFYTVQANSNLATANWSVIGSATANGTGSFSFTDTNAALYQMRFYRVLSP